MGMTKKELQRHKDDLLRRAEGGDPKAQLAAGFMYASNGICISPWETAGWRKEYPVRLGRHRYQEAAKWFRRAAEQGDPEAQHELGLMLHYGRHIGRDCQEGVQWLMRASEHAQVYVGSAACLYLGAIYEDGDGVAQDYREARKWYRRAAELGDEVGQLNLGLMYYYGRGVTDEDAASMAISEEAARWFRRAAEQGSAVAQRAMGYIYRDGEGVSRNYTEAYKWAVLAVAGHRNELSEYRRISARSGFRRVLRNLFCISARRVPRRFIKRCLEEIRSALELKDQLALAMSPEQIAVAQRCPFRQSHY